MLHRALRGGGRETDAVADEARVIVRAVTEAAGFTDSEDAAQRVAARLERVGDFEERERAVVEADSHVETVRDAHLRREGAIAAREDPRRRAAKEPDGEIERVDTVVDGMTAGTSHIELPCPPAVRPDMPGVPRHMQD